MYHIINIRKMESAQLHTLIQSEERLTRAQRKLLEAAEELAFMEILGREERIELPRLTPLNRPLIDRALAASKGQKLEPHAINELERAVEYYQQLQYLNDSITILQEKLRSAQISIGARIYNRSKDIYHNIYKKDKKQLEPIFFPLQPEDMPTKRAIHKNRVRNEAIPIADIEIM